MIFLVINIVSGMHKYEGGDGSRIGKRNLHDECKANLKEVNV